MLSIGPGSHRHIRMRDEHIPRLWQLSFSKSGSELINAFNLVAATGQYEYVSAPWGLDYYRRSMLASRAGLRCVSRTGVPLETAL